MKSPIIRTPKKTPIIIIFIFFLFLQIKQIEIPNEFITTTKNTNKEVNLLPFVGYFHDVKRVPCNVFRRTTLVDIRILDHHVSRWFRV